MEIDIVKPFSNYPTISRPTLFNDTAALREGIEATEHIPWFLDMWQDASPKRRNTAGVQRKSVLKMFMEVDASKTKPSWTNQWIQIVIEDYENDCDIMSIDPLSFNPSEAQYALFLDYYCLLRRDEKDTDGGALLLLNMERKKMGLRSPLELGRPRFQWGSVCKDNRTDGEINITDNMDGMDDRKSEITLGSLSADELSAELMDNEVEAVSQAAQESHKPDECDDIIHDSPQDARVESMDVDVSASPVLENSEIHPSNPNLQSPPLVERPLLSPIQYSCDSSTDPSTMGFKWDVRPYHSASHSSSSDSTMKTGNLDLQTSTISPETTIPIRAVPNGPLSIYDLDGILLRKQEPGMVHLFETLQKWKRLGMLRSGPYPQRISRGVEDQLERERMRLIGEFASSDKLLAQPSWVSQWIQFALCPRIITSPALFAYQPDYSHFISEFRLIIEFFSTLMETSMESRQEAITLLNKARKKAGLELTLELPAQREREFQLVGEGVDFEEMIWDGDDGFPQFIITPRDTNRVHSSASTDCSSSDEYSFSDESETDHILEAFSADESDTSIHRIGNAKAPIGPKSKSQKKKSLRTTLRQYTKPSGRGYLGAGGRDVLTSAFPRVRSLYLHDGSKGTEPQITVKPWSRPQLLPFTSPPPSSSNEAVIPSQYEPMLSEIGKPEAEQQHVWAKTRPELCETATYFRSFQSGVHADKRSRMVGYLVDGFPSRGDIWAKDGRLIISHGGGASKLTILETGDDTSNPEVDTLSNPHRLVPANSIAYPRNTCDEYDLTLPRNAEPPKRRKPAAPSRDQSQYDSSTRNLIKAKELGVPIVLLVGDSYRWWPLMMKRDPADQKDGISRAKYAVLGWYRVRDFWEEFEPGEGQESTSNPNEGVIEQVSLYVRCKFAFEWVEAQGMPWWVRDLERAYSKWLPRPSVTNEEPVLSPPATHVPPTTTNPPEHSSLNQDLSDLTNVNEQPLPITYTCNVCLQESPLIYHQGWFCTNQQCDQMGLLPDGRFSTEITLSYSHDFINRPPLPEPGLKGLEGTDISDFIYSSNDKWSVIPRYREDHKTYEREHWNGRCCRNCGRLNSKIRWNSWVCASCEATIELANGDVYPAAEFLKESTKKNLGMHGLIKEQWGMPEEDSSLFYGDLIDGGRVYLVRPATTDHFDPLFMEYQRAGIDNDMFRRSPLKISPVPGQYTSHFQHNAGVPYNFSCHVKTESFEEGPYIARKVRDILGDVASKILDRNIDFNEVLSCAYKRDQKMNFHSDNEVGVQGTIAALSLGSPARMTFRPKPPKGETTAVCMELRLQHGDILIMDGIGIQENYQHRVVPTGLRFAATARVIERPQGDSNDHSRRWKAQAKAVTEG